MITAVLCIFCLLYYCSTKCMNSLNLKHNSFHNENNGKTTHRFAPRPDC